MRAGVAGIAVAIVAIVAVVAIVAIVAVVACSVIVTRLEGIRPASDLVAVVDAAVVGIGFVGVGFSGIDATVVIFVLAALADAHDGA